MRRLNAFVFMLCAAAVLPSGAEAQTPAGASPASDAATATILLDVVARDKQGALARDLTGADFELTEDGTPQVIRSFGVVDRVKGSGPGSGAPEASVAAILVQRADQTEARALAHDVVKTFVERCVRPSDVTGIFLLDRDLHALQPFTADIAALKAAAEKTSSFALSSEAGQSAVPPPTPAQTALTALAGAEARTRETFRRLEREGGDYQLTHALVAVADGLRVIPGRKTLLLIAEGLSLNAGDQMRFAWVADAANRANVAVYVLDVSRLRAASSQSASRDEMRRVFDEAQRRGEDPTQRAAGMGVMERGEAMLHIDPQAQMEELARDTGGFLIRDTHAMGATLSRVDEDRRCHYLLGYSPTNASHDGRFRKISLAVKRPGIQLQSRKGYFAVRAEGPLLAYELPALAALQQRPLPQDVPLKAGALLFPEAEGEARVIVVAEAPAGALRFAESPKGYRSDFAVLGQVGGETSAARVTVSERYQIEQPADRIEATKKNTLIIFRREVRLPAGRHTVDVVGYDALASKAGARSLTFYVPEKGGLRLSSLVLIKRIDAAKADDDRDIPLCVGDAMIHPNLGDPVRKSQQPQLAFYFNVYGAGGPSVPPAALEVWQGEKRLAEVPMTLAAPDDKGRIQQVGALPIASLPLGAYELRIRVGDGPSAQSRSASFTVVD